ncbi:MAG: PHP domain-containing protein [Candidatus Omnitrophica bacterium]|nr:PHP domain-containing protein [Candidatus Omnitrophota bacterium]
MPPSAVDLHLHSYYSDGTFSPEEVVSTAAARGLRTIALTDHDTVAGLGEARQAATRHGLRLIAGLELSSLEGGTELHLLGYFVDDTDAAFRSKLAELQSRRVERIRKMVARVNALGQPVTVEEVLALASHGTVGRLHLARALVARGCVATVEAAFDRWLAEGGPGYVREHPLSAREAIRLIRGVGGVPILAHPSTMRRDELIPKLREMGLAGLEAHHSSHSADTIERYVTLAREQGLLVTGGSDCHGMAKGRIIMGEVDVPEHVVSDLEQWRKQHVDATFNR